MVLMNHVKELLSVLSGIFINLNSESSFNDLCVDWVKNFTTRYKGLQEVNTNMFKGCLNNAIKKGNISIYEEL